MSRFDGHRIYNGCPDSTLQAEWDRVAKLVKKLQKEIPGTFCTWFPIEQYWTVTARDPYMRPEGAAYTQLAQHRDKETAINTALENDKMWLRENPKLYTQTIGDADMRIELNGMWDWTITKNGVTETGTQRTAHRAKIIAVQALEKMS